MIHGIGKKISRVDRRRAVRTNEILDAAQRVIIEDGIDALTMPRLAKALDAAVGAVYRYFDGKQALIGALQQRAIRDFRARLIEALDETPDDGLHRVAAAWAAWREFGASEPALHGLVDAMLSDPRRLLDSDVAAGVQRELDEVLRPVAQAIAQAQSEGALSDGDAMARTHALWAALHGLDHFRKRDPQQPVDLHSDRIGDILIRALLGGWGASPAALIFL